MYLALTAVLVSVFAAHHGPSKARLCAQLMGIRKRPGRHNQATDGALLLRFGSVS